MKIVEPDQRGVCWRLQRHAATGAVAAVSLVETALAGALGGRGR